MSLTTARYVFAVIGLVMLVCALVGTVHTASFVRHAARAPGTVTALVRHASTDYSNTNGSINSPVTTYSYLPVVRFQLGARQIQFTDAVASNPPAYHVGETVTVLYLESQPFDARIESFLSLWFTPLMFGGGGTIFLAFGTGMILGSRPAPPKV